MTDEHHNRHDQQWLDALAGKPNSEAGPLLNSQAAQVRKELATRRNALDEVVPHADEALFERIKREALNQEKSGKQGLLRSWQAILGFVLASFILGVAVTRVMMVPSLQATRSITPSEGMSGWRRSSAVTNPALPVVVVRVENPLATVQVVSTEAIRLGLRVSVEPAKSGYRVTLDRLTPYAPAEQSIRQALGLNDSASGLSVWRLWIRSRWR